MPLGLADCPCKGFLRVQYGTVAYMSLVVAGALFTIYMFRQAHSVFVGSFTLALVTALSFLIGGSLNLSHSVSLTCICEGAFCSALAGFVGVFVSIRVNIRVAAAAARLHYPGSVITSGEVSPRSHRRWQMLCSSLFAVALSRPSYPLQCASPACVRSTSASISCSWSLEVNSFKFYACGGSRNCSGIPPQQVPMLLGGYGFGASFVALFMQLGGGIYTKVVLVDPRILLFSDWDGRLLMLVLTWSAKSKGTFLRMTLETLLLLLT